MKKKLLPFLLAGILAAGTLTGCGNSSQEKSDGASADGEVGAQAQGGKNVNGIDISDTYEATMILIGSQ